MGGRRDLGFFKGKIVAVPVFRVRLCLPLKMNLHRDCPLQVFSSQGSQFRVEEAEALCRVGDRPLQSLPHGTVSRNVNDAPSVKASYLRCKSVTSCLAFFNILRALVLKISILCWSLTPMKKHARSSICLYNPSA